MCALSHRCILSALKLLHLVLCHCLFLALKIQMINDRLLSLSVSFPNYPVTVICHIFSFLWNGTILYLRIIIQFLVGPT